MNIITEDITKNIEPCAATIGFFDGVHKGHKFLISQLKETSQKKGIKSAIVTFPVHPRKVLNDEFQPKLLSTKDEKIKLLEQTDIDYCIMLNFSNEIASLSAAEFMTRLKTRYNVTALLIGYDHKFGHNRAEGFDDYCKYGKEIGIEIIHAEKYDNENLTISSSAIRRLIESGDIEKANNMLGYRYFIAGEVVDGYKLGRKLGYPTANIKLPVNEKTLPPDGVYAVYIYIDGNRKKGMLNIGNRPTISQDSEKSIEVNIFDFSDNLYGKDVKVEFVSFVRKEEKYPSVEKLIEQLDIDKKTVLNILE